MSAFHVYITDEVHSQPEGTYLERVMALQRRWVESVDLRRTYEERYEQLMPPEVNQVDEMVDTMQAAKNRLKRLFKLLYKPNNCNYTRT